MPILTSQLPWPASFPQLPYHAETSGHVIAFLYCIGLENMLEREEKKSKQADRKVMLFADYIALLLGVGPSQPVDY